MEGLSAHGINVQSATDARSTVQQLIADAQRLPEMPAWVDYRPLLADIAQWVEALQAVQADVGAAQQAAGQRTAENAKELAAADEAADPEAHYRLSWLSQQHPLVESRLGEVEGLVGPPAGTALAALQELAQRIQGSKVCAGLRIPGDRVQGCWLCTAGR